MRKLLIGVLAVLLLGMSLVAADTFPAGAQPGNRDPKIYLVDKFFDWGLDDELEGGSTPDGFDAQLDGSVTPQSYPRNNEYAFTGEQVSEVIIARDLNGAADLSYAKVTVDTYTEALCMELTPTCLKTGEGGVCLRWSVTLHNRQKQDYRNLTVVTEQVGKKFTGN